VAYLLIFPFTGLGMAIVIGLGALAMMHLGRQDPHRHDRHGNCYTRRARRNGLSMIRGREAVKASSR